MTSRPKNRPNTPSPSNELCGIQDRIESKDGHGTEKRRRTEERVLVMLVICLERWVLMVEEFDAAPSTGGSSTSICVTSVRNASYELLVDDPPSKERKAELSMLDLGVSTDGGW